MQYKEIKQGYFLARPNRFIAHVELDGQVEVCHVKNTGPRASDAESGGLRGVPS
jgi:DNA-binding sugar fermentation-stimulating protein